MTKERKKQAEEEPQAFPITLAEFLEKKGPAQIEMRKAFGSLMKREGEVTKKRTDKEWEQLYILFSKMPVDAEWATWKNKEKKEA